MTPTTNFDDETDFVDDGVSPEQTKAELDAIFEMVDRANRSVR